MTKTTEHHTLWAGAAHTYVVMLVWLGFQIYSSQNYKMEDKLKLNKRLLSRQYLRLYKSEERSPVQDSLADN